jgi:molybdopterin converting factor small subunit
VSETAVSIEFFGPFREFGKGLELEVSGETTFLELVHLLAARFGEAFEQRSLNAHSTVIHNRKVVDRDMMANFTIAPGDRLAFGLLLGGG